MQVNDRQEHPAASSCSLSLKITQRNENADVETCMSSHHDYVANKDEREEWVEEKELQFKHAEEIMESSTFRSSYKN